MSTSPSIALTIAGSDSSGGAGIQADLKTFSALGVYGASVIAALTAQNTQGVTGVLAVPPDFIALQIDAVARDLKVGATKTGMLGEASAVEAVCDGLERHDLGPLVVDPVMVATSGDVLLAPDAIDLVTRRLIPRAAVITPNLAEAARLLGSAVAVNIHDMEMQARDLLALGCGAVLIKGGHMTGDEAIDVLVVRESPERAHRFSAARIETRNTHGTGCTLSAAIAAGLAGGLSLIEAASAAKRFLADALAEGRSLAIGKGSGPVDHLLGRRGPSR
ncbi:MAG: bifunctional hydroxymethylpyrimidine kinase/phosphomethylpyrimidine kinase [Hyphomicrobiaceae bacterium]|nr:bifunctional hydroxymethylpyrimidine kinase/phosphomethylpyrimidine kinase [Hyphomicrobiaceae bacterium]